MILLIGQSESHNLLVLHETVQLTVWIDELSALRKVPPMKVVDIDRMMELDKVESTTFYFPFQTNKTKSKTETVEEKSLTLELELKRKREKKVRQSN